MSSELEDRVKNLEEAVNILVLHAEGRSETPETPGDSTWTCDSCGSLLGVYDPEEDVVRRKYKDDVTYATLGTGGSITAICRKCACPCTLTREDLDGLKEALVRETLGRKG